ncbi:hypothetical protein M5689_019486 [Euphorbia peplus]|nr:hypothetical protein M5689_019486 [Euphorbia peplus]
MTSDKGSHHDDNIRLLMNQVNALTDETKSLQKYITSLKSHYKTHKKKGQDPRLAKKQVKKPIDKLPSTPTKFKSSKHVEIHVKSDGSKTKIRK